MRVLPLFSVVSVVLFFTACAKNRPLGQNWPASIGSIKGLTEEQTRALRNGLAQVNKKVGKTLVNTESTNTFNIHFTISPSEQNSEGMKIGHADLSPYECTITLTPDLFSESTSDYFIPVLMHEIGHCAGLVHDPREGEIMYKFASPIYYYSSQAIKDFADTTSRAIHLF